MMKPHEACLLSSAAGLGRHGPSHLLVRHPRKRGTDHLSERPDAGPDVPGNAGLRPSGGNPPAPVTTRAQATRSDRQSATSRPLASSEAGSLPGRPAARGKRPELGGLPSHSSSVGRRAHPRWPRGSGTYDGPPPTPPPPQAVTGTGRSRRSGRLTSWWLTPWPGRCRQPSSPPIWVLIHRRVRSATTPSLAFSRPRCRVARGKGP